jgi:hypothetical protein
MAAMRTVKSMLYALLLTSCGMALGGCLDFDHLQIHLDIGERLSGEVTLRIVGIRSDEASPKAQREEMRKFYEGEGLKLAESAAAQWGLDDPQISFLNKTDLRCDVEIKGKFENLVRSLAPMTETCDFQISKGRERFSVTLLSGENWRKCMNDKPFTFSVRYGGAVASHNAHIYEPDPGLMTWESSEFNAEGIRFVLAFED